MFTKYKTPIKCMMVEIIKKGIEEKRIIFINQYICHNSQTWTNVQSNHQESFCFSTFRDDNSGNIWITSPRRPTCWSTSDYLKQCRRRSFTRLPLDPLIGFVSWGIKFTSSFLGRTRLSVVNGEDVVDFVSTLVKIGDGKPQVR